MQRAQETFAQGKEEHEKLAVDKCPINGDLWRRTYGFGIALYFYFKRAWSVKEVDQKIMTNYLLGLLGYSK